MKTIKINAIQFAELCGREFGKILTCDERSFFIGERVTLQVYSISDGHPTGAIIERFIVDIECLSTSRDEDTFYCLSLSALKPDVCGIDLPLL